MASAGLAKSPGSASASVLVPPSLDKVAIDFDCVGLVRRSQQELHYDIKRSALSVFRARTQVKQRTVLSDLSIRINEGEKVGIIGPNGSGKSTLLKLVAGILRPTTGSIRIVGNVAPLIELGVGFDAELSLVDNVLYYGALLGHDESLVRRHVDEILDFAELSEYKEDPTKTLSSGMHARLSFAIATQFRADIILLDEVLSVGDERFRRKCQARIDRFWDERSTIIFVSHDLLSVARLCNRVIWLDQGQVRFDGLATEAQGLYLSTIPSLMKFKDSEELIALAERSTRGEVIVRGTSGHPQLYLVRDSRRYFIGTAAWCERNGYAEADVKLVDDAVILELPEGEVLL